MAEGTRPTGGWLEPSTLLIVTGVTLVFVAFLVVAVWQAAYAMYVLLGGVVVLILGFVVASRSH